MVDENHLTSNSTNIWDIATNAAVLCCIQKVIRILDSLCWPPFQWIRLLWACYLAKTISNWGGRGVLWITAPSSHFKYFLPSHVLLYWKSSGSSHCNNISLWTYPLNPTIGFHFPYTFHKMQPRCKSRKEFTKFEIWSSLYIFFQFQVIEYLQKISQISL